MSTLKYFFLSVQKRKGNGRPLKGWWIKQYKHHEMDLSLEEEELSQSNAIIPKLTVRKKKDFKVG